MAFDTWAGRVFGDLIRMVTRRFPSAEEGQVAESAEDALLAYRDDPKQFDPTRGVPLPHYLAMTAGGHLRHRLRKERGRRLREQTGLLGDRTLEKTLELRATRRVELAIYGRGTEEDRQELERLLPRLGLGERAAVELLREGNRSVEAWLPLLDIGHLTPKEQQRRITNERVRIIRKLRGLLREAAVA